MLGARSISKLSRTREERKRLMRGLCYGLVNHEKVETSMVRAKCLKKVAEKLLTRAREKNTHNFRVLSRYLPHKPSVEKLFEIAQRMQNRPGGYTRITKLGVRKGDGAMVCRVEWV